MAVTFGGRACCDPATLYTECQSAGLPTDWAGKANAFAVPAGREAGRGFVLLTAADLAALDAAADHELAFTGSDPGHAVTLSPVTLIRSECISPGGPGDGAAVFLCELADRRHFLAKVYFANGHKSYNVAAPDGAAFQTASLNSGSPWTWAEVLADLSGLLGIGTVTPPFTPDGNPENLIFKGSVWGALNDVLARLACVLCYDPTDDTFSTVRLGVAPNDPLTALEASADYLGVSWDGYAGETVRGWRPEKVRVRFPRRPQPAAATGGTEYYTVDVTLPAVTGVKAGTYELLDDDLSAIGATGTPANTAQLSARATERATDWLRQRQYAGRPLTRAWRDIQPLALAAVGQSVSKVVFDDRGETIRTWAIALSSRDIEEWRPLADYPPWWPFEFASRWKEPAYCRTTGPLPTCAYNNGAGGVGATLTASSNGTLPAQDAISPLAGYSLLVADQANAAHNGIYIVTQRGDASTPWVLTRRGDADSSGEFPGAAIVSLLGDQHGNVAWLCGVGSPPTVGTSHILWTRFGPYLSPLTTKGDLFVRSATGDARLPAGTNGYALVADSTQPLGLKYDQVVRGPTAAGGALVAWDVATGKISVPSATTLDANGRIYNMNGLSSTGAAGVGLPGSTFFGTDPALYYTNGVFGQLWCNVLRATGIVGGAALYTASLGPAGLTVTDEASPFGSAGVYMRRTGTTTSTGVPIPTGLVLSSYPYGSSAGNSGAIIIQVHGGFGPPFSASGFFIHDTFYQTVTACASGTIGPGAIFQGGLCTNIGSGSFLADPGDGLAGGTYS